MGANLLLEMLQGFRINMPFKKAFSSVNREAENPVIKLPVEERKIFWQIWWHLIWEVNFTLMKKTQI